jgi:hypothetical protein
MQIQLFKESEKYNNISSCTGTREDVLLVQRREVGDSDSADAGDVRGHLGALQCFRMGGC